MINYIGIIIDLVGRIVTKIDLFSQNINRKNNPGRLRYLLMREITQDRIAIGTQRCNSFEFIIILVVALTINLSHVDC